MEPSYPADAFYLHSAVVSWLVGRFVQIDTNSFLIASLAEHYGEEAVGQLVSLMQPSSDTGIFVPVTGVTSLEQADLDWRDFLTWRLATEAELIARRDRENFFRLYDTSDPAVISRASQRFDANAPEGSRVVVRVLPETGPEGRPQLRATVRVGENAREEEVLFRLVDNIWLRAD